MPVDDPETSSSPRKGESGVYRTVIDVEEDPFDWAIYDAISKGLGLDPESEEIPVEAHINPDALVSLFVEQSGDVFVSFPVQDARVTVWSDGSVEVDCR